MHSRVLALPQRLAALLALLLAALLVPAVGHAADAAPASGKAGPSYHRPKVGVCYDYGVTGLSSLTGPKKTVPCDESHRAITVAVPVVDADFSDPENPAIFEKAGARCYRAAYRALGGTHEARALTAYNIGYYVPTKAEIAKGAHWVRCDLLLFGGNRLLPLTTPYLAATPDDSTALCLTGAGTRGAATVCERKHKYRAVGVVEVAGDAYPSDRKFDRIGSKRCGAVTGSDTFLYRWPNEQAWDAGKHLLTCYAKIRS